MSQLALVELAKRLHDSLIVTKNSPGDELKDLGMNFVLMKVLLQLVICTFEYYLFLDERSCAVKDFLRSLVAYKVLMLCKHHEKRILESKYKYNLKSNLLSHVQRDVVKEFHHTCYHAQ